MFIFVAWTLGFSIIILLPLDVYISYIHHSETTESLMQFVWRFNYWVAFFLCNFVFPMLGEYVVAGDFTVKDKLWTWFIQNMIFYLIIGVLGGIALIYLWIKGQFEGPDSSFSGFIIFWMNAYGLILIVLFLSYGIVAVPKKYYGMKSFDFRKKFVYWKVYCREEVFQDKKFNLEELAATAIALSHKVKTAELKKYNQIILDKCPEEFKSKAKGFATSDILEDSYKPDLKSLIKLNKNMKKGIEDYERAQCSLNESLTEAVWLEDIDSSSPDTFHSRLGGSLMKYDFYRTFIWNWEKKLKPIMSFVLFIIFTIFSVLILFGEVSIYLLDYQKSVIKDIFVNNLNNFILTLIVIRIPLGYLWFCTFYGLFHLKLFGLYALHPNQHTDSFSLNFSASLVTRLAPPLWFNFILLERLKGTVFENFMGEMKWVPVLGVSFQQLFPIVLVVLAVFNICNVWGALLKLIGLDSYSFESKYDREKAIEGINYVKFQRRRIERESVDDPREVMWEMDSEYKRGDHGIGFISRSS